MMGMTVKAQESTGASAAFTSSDPVVKQALGLVNDGKLKDAQSLLASDDGHASDDVQRTREEMKEIIRRTRRDYGQSAAEFLAKLKKDIPDVTAEDIEKWRKAGEVQWRMIDGEVKYFRREPANLFRFCEEAKKRRVQKDEVKEEGWTLVKHLANVVAEAQKTGKTEVMPIKHRLTYTVTIDGNRPGAQPGSVVRVWLPFLQEYRQQKDVKLVSWTEPPGTCVRQAMPAPNGTPQRTVYYEHAIKDPTKPMTFSQVMEYTSYAYYPQLKDEDAKPLPSNWGDQDLTERLPHIAFSPELKAKVAEIVGSETNPLAKARKIWQWCDANIKYHAEEEYSIIPSFAQVCFKRGRGDCGVQSVLFITMCRAAGVPARWQSGWETKRERNSMHDWAEFYVEPWGWLPADQSYGVQKSDDPKVRDFYLGHQDSYRTIINLDYGQPLTPAKKSLRSEPADFQVGEIEIDGRNLFYDEWDWDMKIEWLTEEKM